MLRECVSLDRGVCACVVFESRSLIYQRRDSVQPGTYVSYKNDFIL